MIFFQGTSLYSFILFSLLANIPIAIGMEREQDKPMEHKNAHLSLTSPVFFSVDSNPFSSYIIHFKNKPHRYLNDPLIRVKLSFANSSLSIAIPVKHLFNLNDKSELPLILESPQKDKKPMHISAFCTKNLLMPDTCFKNQFERMMASFYRSPICTASSVRTLIEAEVIKKENISDAVPIYSERGVEYYGSGVAIRQSSFCIKNCMHGTKGCPDEKTFISLITKPKTKPYNNSLHQLLVNRQTGAKRSPKPINLDLFLDNCLKEMECAEIASEKLLDDCFNELVVMMILTRALIILPIIKECAASLIKKSRPL